MIGRGTGRKEEKISIKNYKEYTKEDNYGGKDNLRTTLKSVFRYPIYIHYYRGNALALKSNNQCSIQTYLKVIAPYNPKSSVIIRNRRGISNNSI